MKRVASKMKLFRGFEEEYRRRHDAIWPELKALLKNAGIRDYSIFLDPGTSELFACFIVDTRNKLDELRHQIVMKRWWHYMKDIMETNDDESPVSVRLTEVFHLP